MYLKALRLKGFKSFATQTTLVFEPGIGVIIGPNGSGKSNIADAVVWALGEQSPTTLRGSSMQDVIFAGSDGRRPLASAEAELTFDNADGSLPLPTPEVSVMRRVTRDGASHYSINHSTCRLTDVVELLAPLGLGKELHSIIGQGKVEAFLAGKPEDRRAQIEEAAGLGAYKRRRERAEIKLREVRRNLERAALLEREVDAQLAPLRRQATAAEQLASIAKEIAGLRSRLLSGELRALEAEAAGHAAERATLEAQRRHGESELAALAAARAREEETFARRLAERERRAQRILRARVIEARLDSSRRLTAQRALLAEEVERAALAERERLLHELTAHTEEPAQDQWPEREHRLTDELTAAQATYQQLQTALEEARAAQAAQRTALETATAEREAALAEATRCERRRRALDGEATHLEAQRRQLADEETAADRAETAARAQETSDREALRAAASAAAAAATAAHDAAEREKQAEARHRAADLAARAAADEIDHLRATLRDLEDVADDVLAVAQGYPGTASLALSLSCEPGNERALAAALSQATGALAVPPQTDCWSLLEALQQAGVSLARLVVAAPARRPTATWEGATPLLAKVDAGGHPELESLLADVVLVDDLRTVPADFPGMAVTRGGAYWRPLAGQLGLAAGLPAALLLERRAALARRESELPDLEQQAATAEHEHAVARRESTAAGEARAEAAAREQAARRAADAAGRTLAGIKARRREAQATATRQERSAERIAADGADLAAAAEAAASQAAAALVRIHQAQPQAAAAEAQRRAAEEAYAAAQAAVTRCRVELEEQRAAARRAEARAAAARERAAAGRARIAELDRRLSALPGQRAACAALLTRSDALRARSAATLHALEAANERETGGLERRELRVLAEREADLRRDLDAATERNAVVRVTLAHLDDRRRELAEKLAELTPLCEGVGTASDDDEAGALTERLERLVRRRERMGPVNPLAAAECAELEERASFLREQRRDLEQSVRDLEQLIKELTTRVDEEFTGTFAAVQEQFRHMVALLFPGGHGSLELVEPTEAGGPGGVSVSVKPAKKLGRRLQLLSGGERALVAIAFLMALVLARPSPLYILDEVEAALDDVNIGRLVQLLRDYRERTQFIVITHQKRTMDAADVLYGVTMGPDGASQVVSARMAAAAIEREAHGDDGTGSAPATPDRR